MTTADLVSFERDVADLWNAGKLRAPTHLSGGNEEQLIEIFSAIHRNDWVLSNYRWHYHALLHGIPRDTVMQWILDGRGMCVASEPHQFLTSAIVGGLLPVAVGIAAGLKRSGSERTVWCFLGDMGATIGAYHEARQYAQAHELPVIFVIEDNGMSCNSPTDECWTVPEDIGHLYEIRYRYERTWPHVGTGRWIDFR